MNGSALGDTDDPTDTTAPSTDDLSQLTFSEAAAGLPSTTVTNDTLHMAWADGVSPSVTVRWKCSSDGGYVFCADRTLTKDFYSITNVKISSSESGVVAVMFEGRSTRDNATGIYAVCSPDNGNNWTQVYFVYSGSGAAVAVHDGSVFLGLFHPVNGTDVFSVLRMEVNGTALKNAMPLMSFAAPQSKIRLLAGQDCLLYALVAGPDHRQVVMGSIDYSGQFASQPAVVWSAASGCIIDLQLASDNGAPVAVMTWDHGLWSSIEYGSADTGIGLWNFASIHSDHGTFGNASLQCADGHRVVAWECDHGSNVSISFAELDSDGEMMADPYVISTAVSAYDPLVVYLPSAGFDCLLVHQGPFGPEVFVKRDVFFDRPDLERLMEWISEQNVSAFYGDESIRTALLGSLSNIREAFLRNDIVEAHDLIEQASDGLTGYSYRAVAVNMADPETGNVSEKLTENLAYYAGQDQLSAVLPYSPPSDDGDLISEGGIGGAHSMSMMQSSSDSLDRAYLIPGSANDNDPAVNTLGFTIFGDHWGPQMTDYRYGGATRTSFSTFTTIRTR